MLFLVSGFQLKALFGPKAKAFIASAVTHADRTTISIQLRLCKLMQPRVDCQEGLMQPRVDCQEGLATQSHLQSARYVSQLGVSGARFGVWGLASGSEPPALNLEGQANPKP